MKHRTLIAVTLLLLLVSPLPCVAGNWTDNWESIQKASASVSSVRASFTQSKHMKILSRPLVSKGLFYFQAPDSVRWEYTAPVKSILLMQRKGIKRYTQSATGLVEDSGAALQSMQVVLKEIGEWTKGHFSSNTWFAATLKAGKVVMTPRDKAMTAMIERIEITPAVDRPGVLQSVRIVEGEGNFTLLEFSDVQVNGPIPESIFRSAQ